jgi:dipeptidyl aminopeptidase/acylaminoacyl peptidase
MTATEVAAKAVWPFLAALLLVTLALGLRAFWTEYRLAPPSPVPREEALRRLPGLTEVSWVSEGTTIRGWFLKGRERAAVVLVHGDGGNRGDVLPELEILNEQGFAVLAFDWPGQGESGGVHGWDEAERASLRGALDWLASQPAIDAHRIGGFGFSMGGFPLVQVAVVDPRLRALALAGTPGDLGEYTRWEYRRRGLPAQWGALMGVRARGMRVSEQVPVQIVPSLAPRPLLVILGEDDSVVPPSMTRALFEAARQPKELVALPDTDHGEYASKGGRAYAEALVSFFTRALLAPPAQGN